MSFRGPACGQRGCVAGRTADFPPGRDLGGPQRRLRRGADHRRADPSGGSPHPAGGTTSSRFGSPGGADRARGSSSAAADYRRLAHEILAHPEWITAGGLPRRKGARVRGGLIDEALATATVAVGCGASGPKSSCAKRGSRPN